MLWLIILKRIVEKKMMLNIYKQHFCITTQLLRVLYF